MKIFITGFESTPEQGGVSGWEWRATEADRDEQHEEFLKLKDCTVYKGELEISDNVTDGYEITQLVEMYLDENDYDNAFDNKIHC